MDAGTPPLNTPTAEAKQAAQPPPVQRSCLERVLVDGGALGDPTDFTGFSADGMRFAFSVHSEGVGAAVLTILEPPKTVVRRFLLDAKEAKVEANAYLADGGFSREHLAPDFDVNVEGVTAQVSLRDGGVIFRGSPFEGTPGVNTRARVWGCDLSGRHAALEVSTQYESEFGNARGFVVFEVNGGR